MTSIHSTSNTFWRSAQLIWEYLHMGHHIKSCSAAIGLGSHDVGVATECARLYHMDLFPVLVFSGGNSRTTRTRFPRGEAVHYREHALSLGVPDAAILVESAASNTGQNISLSRQLLTEYGVDVKSLLLVSKPYMERRAYATCRKLWHDVEVTCASQSQDLENYVQAIGDVKLVIDMLVGELERIVKYPKFGFSIVQDVPSSVLDAGDLLVGAGFNSRQLSPAKIVPDLGELESGG